MKISIIIPVRNQSEKVLRNLTNKILPYFDKTGVVYDVTIVDDYSNDESHQSLVKGLKKLPAQVHLLPFENVPGKGHAVKRGILSSDGDYVLFMDSDCSTDLKVFDRVIPLLNQYDCFIASRFSKGSKINNKRGLIRRLDSWGSRTLIKMKFHIKGVKDTQCGYKIFRGDVAKWMASRSIIDGFAFDVEYLYFLYLNHFSIKELPVSWSNDENDSTVSPLHDALVFAKSLRKIKKNKCHYYLSDDEKKSLLLSREENANHVN